jgi:hypothetical protein
VKQLVLVAFALAGCVERGLPITPIVDLASPTDSAGVVADLSVPAKINGSFGGTTFAPAVVISDDTPASPGNPAMAAIYLADQPMLCPDLTLNHSQPRAMAYLQIQIIPPPQAKGTFPVGTTVGNRAVVKFIRTDEECATIVEENAVGGSVTLTAIVDKAYGGSFDLKMAATGSSGATDHVTGQFQARYCGALGPLAQGGLSATCQ